MVIYGVKCVVVKPGGYDGYGERLAGTRYPDKCAVVKLEERQQGSTVRVDSGATRGGAEEKRAEAVLLMPKTSRVAMDDVIEVCGVKLRVIGRRMRFTVGGRLDHFQVEATIEQ